MTPFQIVDPRLDHRRPGEFTVNAAPVFSWKMACRRQGAFQSACQITVKDENGEILWDTGKVFRRDSAAVEWAGEPLRSRQRGTWSLTVWDDAGASQNTGDIPFEATLFHNRDWQARWIYFDGNNPAFSAPCPYFRKKFTLAEDPVRARLYISAKGLFEASINGTAVGEDRFVPGWSDFNKSLQFLTYDVTASCHKGENLIGAILGEGWYCGCGRRKNYYGKYPELLIQLELTFADGSVKKVLSGNNWKCATGPLMYSDIYDGEFYDGRAEMPGWDTVNFNDRRWRKAAVGSRAADSDPLIPKIGEPVRQMMKIKPVKILHPKPDVWIWDAGQNVSGIPRVKIGGSRGRLYTIRFGEMLYDDQTLYNLNYRGARATDHCVMNDQGTMWYEPKFTFHGFRYMQIDGFQFSNSAFTVDDVEVEILVLYSPIIGCLGAFNENSIYSVSNSKLSFLSNCLIT